MEDPQSLKLEIARAHDGGSGAASGARPGSPLESSRHVLVVEDDPAVATALMAYLQDSGRVLHLAASAARAEEILATDAIDLVVLDLVLPDRDGRDVLLRLREDPRTAAVPVIVLSSKGGVVAKAECMEVGANEFLEKPPDPKTLRAAVALHLNGYRRDRDGRTDPATGLLSRAGLVEAFRGERSPTGRVEGPLGIALLIVDQPDRGTANRLVARVAERLTMALGDRGHLGRWSDVELVALLPGTSPSEAQRTLEKVLTPIVAAGLPEDLGGEITELSFAAGFAVADPTVELREVVAVAKQSLLRTRRRAEGISFVAAHATSEDRTRVLLVEHDRVIASLIQHRLVREGFDVMDFLNGEDAYRWVSTSSFDVAILDAKVPGMDGFELLEQFRATARLAAVPIVMLIELGSEADVARGLELGASDYVLKPFSPIELLARVRRLAQEGAQVRDHAPPSSDGAEEATEGP